MAATTTTPKAPLSAEAEKLLQEFDCYADKHNVRRLLRDCIVALGRHKPEDPVAFLSDHFTKLKLKPEIKKVSCSPHLAPPPPLTPFHLLFFRNNILPGTTFFFFFFFI